MALIRRYVLPRPAKRLIDILLARGLLAMRPVAAELAVLRDRSAGRFQLRNPPLSPLHRRVQPQNLHREVVALLVGEHQGLLQP